MNVLHAITTSLQHWKDHNGPSQCARDAHVVECMYGVVAKVTSLGKATLDQELPESHEPRPSMIARTLTLYPLR